MEKYRIVVAKKAKKQLEEIHKSGKKGDLLKIENLILEISNFPRTGTGKPEQLKHLDGEVWSRRINKKDRMVYEIFEAEILITVIRVLGHYDDK